ncbi:MAG: glycerophosphodiester phosphodiesterase, partial [Lachnospiraceae bacterium]|nr:glycerophosphodiester phosphodiesterase [Lachnospiraceae bacterium]
MSKHKIQVWAHRGASAYAPENTMEAYILAHQYGSDGIELDVHLSKDGEVVVIHDEKINRTSEGKGYVRNYTLKQLKKFNYNKTRPTHFRADIPSLAEVLEYMQDKPEMSLNI